MGLLKNMAIRIRTFKYIHKMLRKCEFYDFNGLSMCELGNQFIHCVKGFRTAKEYFESLGIKHTSIDINGLDGALKLNLNEPLNIGEFDIVTNLGTSEHVENHEQCFNNIDNFCKKHGIMIHVLPAKDSFLFHGGFRRYTTDWFVNLAEEKKYKIENLMFGKNDEEGRKHIYCTLRKG